MAASTAFETFLSGAETLLISLSHLKPDTPPPPTTLETVVACAKVGGMIFRKFWCPSALEVGLAVVAEARRVYVENKVKGKGKGRGRGEAKTPKKTVVRKKGSGVKKASAKEKVGKKRTAKTTSTAGKKTSGVQKRTSARKTRATRKPAVMPGAFDDELYE